MTVQAGGLSWQARTFAAHGHHYAMVVADGLEPGTITPYTVEVDGEQVWPPPRAEGTTYPPSVIATLKPGKPLRMAFGSCRTSVSHDATGNRTHGVDALRQPGAEDGAPTRARRWPDLVLFLGDQVYADETTEEMQEFIESRRDIEVPPGKELKDYEEYAHLYWLAWTDPLNRWLLSTLPSSMIFDDHDVRDDWNTSLRVEAGDREDRLVARPHRVRARRPTGSTSTSATSPRRSARDDEMWQQVASHEGDDELDLTEPLDGMAERVDQEPGQLPVELRARRSATSGSSSSTPGPPGCSSPTARDLLDPASWPGSTSSCAATSSTC